MTKIKVALRVRPLSAREVAGGCPVVVGVEDNSAFITDISVPERPSADSRQRFRQFDFDHGFWFTEEGDEGSSQEEVYQEMGPRLEESILEGYNACLLAYGQSGTGKTHTMLGTKEDPGLIPRLCQGLWKKFKIHCSSAEKTFRMDVSFMEIYREKVRDLLAPSESPLKLREHPQLGPHVQGLKRIEIREGLSILDLLWEGERRRATGATGSNRHSSRSHAIWTLYLTSTRKSGDGSELITRNQVHLVDLAGSEKADLITTKHRLAEGKDINRSLVSLGNVISSLAEKARYIPYRDSTLTWLLKDSLGGNATTAIIITASPASSCHAQTLNSLRFAQRARLVENQPKINITKTEEKAKVRKSSGIFSGISAFDLKKDITRLASLIRSAQANGGILRGITPSSGWNRLISVIENWSHWDSGQEDENPDRSQPNRAESLETLTTMNTTTSTSVADGQVQVDSNSEEASSSSSPLSKLPKKPGNEFFIPMSNSFKCLTWRQEEVQQVPKSPDESEDEVFVSPPTTPKLDVKVHHTKYVVPLHFPVTRNVEADGRMSERIHGRIEKLREPIQICPTEVRNHFESSPVVRSKYPSLVNPQPIRHPFKESCHPFSRIWDENLNYIPSSVQCKGQESDFSFNIPNPSEFSTQATLPVPVFESTDEEDGERSRWERHCKKRVSKLRADRVTTPPCRLGYSYPENSPISSSSYESIQLSKNRVTKSHPHPVKIVQQCSFDFTEIEDQLQALNSPCPHRMATVSCLEDEIVDEEDMAKAQLSPQPPLVKVSPSSKFQKFFVQELNQMDVIGKRLKNLKEKTERYNKIKPYLIQLDDLKLQDHSAPDLELDAEIEHCSGWNVEIEYQKVQKELAAINKILERGPSSTKPVSESSLSNREESSGSMSLESRRSSAASVSNNETFNSQPQSIGMSPKSQPVPVATSTPKKMPGPPYSPSTFWSEFYRKSGPKGDLEDHPNLSKYQNLEEERVQHQQRWRPFLPKTHNYLCHQRGHGVNESHGHRSLQCHRHLPPRGSECYYMHMSPTMWNQVQWERGQKQFVTPHKRHYHVGSLSSEGSSLYDGSQSDPYNPPRPYKNGSMDFCSCQDSLDSADPYWDSAYETQIPNNQYDHAYNSYHNQINFSPQNGHHCGQQPHGHRRNHQSPKNGRKILVNRK